MGDSTRDISRKELSPGEAASATWVVEQSDLASALSREHADAFPAVFATARMVALMELAAARVLTPLLEEGELSVGVSLELRHSAATPQGVTVTARARFLRMEGKLYRFEVDVSDDGGAIGYAIHDRAIIAVERLMAGAKKRCSQR